ncbi:MAG: VOC family protein [Balneolaceae bacterium]|nr:VOC family protein [Balneolaceae bacterium]
MKSLNPYLFFPGNCEEALNYYKDCLNGEITLLQRFGDTDMPVEESWRDKIMHAELKVENIHIMFSDGAPHKTITQGDNVQLNIDFDDPDEQEKLFYALAKDGEISMKLEETFWGARYGMLTDKFGIRWMMNYSLKE